MDRKQNTRRNVNKEAVRIRKKRANRKRNSFFERLTIFLVLLALAYLIYNAYTGIQVEQVVEIFAESGTLESSISGKAKIIRNETVLYSDRDGDVEYYYHEGEKVKNGSILCKVYEKQLTEDLDTKLDELDIMIAKNQSENISQSVKTELASVDEYIYSLIDEYLIYSKTDYAFDVYELKEELESKFAIKRNIYLKNSNTQTSKYISERDNYNNVLAGSYKNIYAPMGGIISYYVDGFEENYTPENIVNLKGKYLQIESSKMITGNKKSEVRSLEAICKVVDNSVWYITAIFDREVTKDWTNNIKKNLRVKNVSDGVLKGTITNVLEYNNTNIVTFQINEQINKYMAFRDIEVEVIENKISGIKIPNSSIAVKKVVGIPRSYATLKQSKYYVIKDDAQLQKKTVSIDIISSDSEYYYILMEDETINIGDRIYEPETNVPMIASLEKEVKGVYQLAGTIYKFKTIDTLVSNDTYSIIENSDSSNIKIYDKIILDCEMVK